MLNNMGYKFRSLIGLCSMKVTTGRVTEILYDLRRRDNRCLDEAATTWSTIKYGATGGCFSPFPPPLPMLLQEGTGRLSAFSQQAMHAEGLYLHITECNRES